MPEFKWITNEDGAKILLVEDKEVARISDAKTMRPQNRPPNDGVITLEQLKAGYEQTFSDG